jgi:hypothetical protein
MRDYIIKINDVTPWRVALRSEALANSPYAYVDGKDEAKLNLPVTGVIARIGKATVSICRLNQDQYDWLTGLPQVTELGNATQYIRDMSDVNWIGAGKGLYHTVHLQTPYDVDDGEGGTVTITPPLLHCILAS